MFFFGNEKWDGPGKSKRGTVLESAKMGRSLKNEEGDGPGKAKIERNLEIRRGGSDIVQILRNIMKIYVDGHCDTLSETLDSNKKISNTQYCFNTIDAKQLVPVIQMSAVFINPKFENGFERANNIIDYYFKNMENTVIIKNKKDIQYVRAKENRNYFNNRKRKSNRIRFK